MAAPGAVRLPRPREAPPQIPRPGGVTAPEATIVRVVETRGIEQPAAAGEPAGDWPLLGRLLVEQGLLSDDQLEEALALQAESGRRIGEVLVGCGFVTRFALARALAQQYGVELEEESGYGSGLRLEIERRQTDLEPPPAAVSEATAELRPTVLELPVVRHDSGREADEQAALAALERSLAAQQAERKRIEAALAESAERLALALSDWQGTLDRLAAETRALAERR
jgi:pyruvate/2-oxoglutarate dehydrogenase complex dihydrolipoamide acyltransferase (E2) component